MCFSPAVMRGIFVVKTDRRQMSVSVYCAYRFTAMIYDINETTVLALSREEISRVASAAYDADGISLYDGVMCYSRDENTLHRLLSDSADVLAARTAQYCTVSGQRLTFNLPDQVSGLADGAATELTRFLSLSVAAAWFGQKYPTAAEGYTSMADEALNKALVLLLTRQTPAMPEATPSMGPSTSGRYTEVILPVARLMALMMINSQTETAGIADVETRYKVQAGTEKTNELRGCLAQSDSEVRDILSRWLVASSRTAVSFTYTMDLKARRLEAKNPSLKDAIESYIIDRSLSKYYEHTLQKELSQAHAAEAAAAREVIVNQIFSKKPPVL